MTFNIAALEDSLAGGKNYIAGQIYQVFNINDTLATIYSDAAGTMQITQDGISNISNTDGEANFYIFEGVYYFTANTKRRDFTAGLGGQLINDLSQTINFDTVAEYESFASALPLKKRAYLADRNAYFNVITGTGTADTFGTISSNLVNQSIAVITNNTIETTHFGAHPTATAAFNSGAISAALAIAAPLGRAVHTESGSYTISAGLEVPSTVEFYGDGRLSTLFIQSALNAPSTMVSTPSGSQHQNIHDVGVRFYNGALGTSTQIGFKILGTRRMTLESCSVDTLDQQPDGSLWSGIGILMDMGTVASAYTNNVIGNYVDGCQYGLWSKGPITSCVFTRNHFKTYHQMRFDRGAVLSGTTAIFGNQIFANTLQSYSNFSHGLGNGIDFGAADSALTFVYAFSNEIGTNYIEQNLNGILLRNGSKNFSIASQNWDNCVSEIVDLNLLKDGYSGEDAQNFKISTRTQIFEVQPKGLLVTDKITNQTTFNGSSATLAISGNGVTINPNRYRLRIWGNGALRTGAILDSSSAIEGEQHSLVGFSWGVGFNMSNIIGATSLTMGSSSGQSNHCSVEYDASLNKWNIMSNNVNP